MYDFIRTVCAVPNLKVADTEFNTLEIIKKIEEAKKENPDFILFGELCISGYTCQDLFFQKTLLLQAKKGILKICDTSKNLSSVIAVGAPLDIGGKLFNCAVVIQEGKIKGIVPKT